ncbi:hypothetical protein HK104_004594, partial [Borealophlyctis nickersoniae]
MAATSVQTSLAHHAHLAPAAGPRIESPAVTDQSASTQAMLKAQLDAFMLVTQMHAQQQQQHGHVNFLTPGYAKLLPAPTFSLPTLLAAAAAIAPSSTSTNPAPITTIMSSKFTLAPAPGPSLTPSPLFAVVPTSGVVSPAAESGLDDQRLPKSPSPSPSDSSFLQEQLMGSGFIPQGTRRRRNSVPEGRVFACDHPECTKTFMQLAHLKIHQVCNFPGCDKSFTQLGNLKTHERKHTGEKPFK